MAGVMDKFIVVSMFMWAVPVAILYGFNNKLIPGSTDLSSSSLTLLSGLLSVVSVHVAIAFYICLAMREPLQKHDPDAKFLSDANAGVMFFKPRETEGSSSTHKKKE